MPVGTKFILSFDGTAVAKGMAAIKGGFAKVFTSFKHVGGGAISSLFGPAAKLVQMLAPLAAGGFLIGLAHGASDTASRFEQIRTSFELFTGDVKKSEKLFEDLRKIDIVSNLNMEALGQGAKTLLQMNVPLKEVSGTLEKLSKISGGNAEKFENLSQVFGQVTQRTYLNGKELNRFVDAGWNPLENIIRRTGEAGKDFYKRMEHKGVSIQEVTQALDDATTGTGRFARAHELGAKTFLSATSRMQSQWQLLQEAFGTPLNIHLGEIFDRITKKLPELTEQAKAWGEELGSVLTMIVNAFGNGDAGKVIQQAFMLAVKEAGSFLEASAITAGELFFQAMKGKAGQSIGEFADKMPTGMLHHAITGRYYGDPKDYKAKLDASGFMDTYKASKEIFGTDKARADMQSTIDRNQGYTGPTTIATQKESDEIMKGIRDTLQKQLDEAKKTNESLKPGI